jgi:rSAM/selenodomain-associated transferase 1
MAKHWRAGLAKTRLAEHVGAELASRLARELLATSLSRFRGLTDHCVLAYSPTEPCGDFADIAPGWELVEQGDGDLGTRLERQVLLAKASGADPIVLIGADAPTLPVERIADAFRLLTDYPVVLGPADDGGYYLLGVRANVPAIFREIGWGTSRVWEQTIERLAEAGVAFAPLPPWYDVDTVDDVRRLVGELSEKGTMAAAETALLAAARACLEAVRDRLPSQPEA